MLLLTVNFVDQHAVERRNVQSTQIMIVLNAALDLRILIVGMFTAL